jgi:isohexenylglutaconyl-CoA hydratase
MTDRWPDFQSILVREERERIHITFNRPEVKNALTHPMMLELQQVVAALPGRRDLRVVVFRGAGGNFCAGGDLSFMAKTAAAPPTGDGADPTVAAYRVFGQVLMALDRVPQAVVSLVEGAAAGGGFGVACSSDVTITLADAVFAMPEARSGFIPGQVVPAITKRIGAAHARRLVVTGDRLDGRQALALGVAHYCVGTAAEAEAKLEQVLGQIRRCAPNAVAAAKRLVLQVGEAEEARLLDDAAEILVDLLRQPEAQEGIAAFFEKRPPAWAR